jgi:endonuclease YncB( thermonuclease family)
MKHITMLGICLWSLVCTQAYASIYEGKVVGVSDGDTLTVLISGRQTKVRLAEIDVPEKRQPFGKRSTQSLSDLVYGKRVKVNQQDLDRYGRVVGRVYTESLDVNAEQIKRGMAWIHRHYNRDRSLLALEQEARGAKRGLWTDPPQRLARRCQWRRKDSHVHLRPARKYRRGFAASRTFWAAKLPGDTREDVGSEPKPHTDTLDHVQRQTCRPS